MEYALLKDFKSKSSKSLWTSWDLNKKFLYFTFHCTFQSDVTFMILSYLNDIRETIDKLTSNGQIISEDLEVGRYANGLLILCFDQGQTNITASNTDPRPIKSWTLTKNDI